MRKLAKNSVGEIALALTVDESGFDREISNIRRTAERAGESVKSSFGGIGSSLNGLGSIAKKAAGILAGAFAVKGIADFGKECLELGSDIAEVQNVVDVTFPTLTSQIDSFAKSAVASFGLSETMTKKFTGTFGSMAEAFGFTERQAADMGATLTGLAGDVASFYNISQDEAYTKLKSVFTGETESLKDLGVVMTQTALDAYAMANGFGKTTQKMSEAEKVALRYAFVQDQLSNAAGDFARTSGSWANQVRILSLQFDSLKANIGQGLINVFTPIIKAVNTLLGKLVTLAGAFKAFTELITGKKSDSADSGIEAVAGSAKAATGGISEAGNAAKKLKDNTAAAGKAAKKAAKDMLGLMKYDELNNLSSSKGSGDKDSKKSDASADSLKIPEVNFGKTDTSETAFDSLGQKAQAVIDKVKELGKLFAKGFKIGLGDLSVLGSIKKEIASIKKSFSNIISDKGLQAAVNNWAKSLATSFGKVAGSITSIGLTIADNILGGISKYLKQHKKDIIKDLRDLFNITGNTAEIVGNFSAVLAEIAEVFRSDDAKQITADIINIFSDSVLNIAKLGQKIGRDLIKAITRPITENKDAIKTALENTIKPIKTVISSISTTVSNTWDKIQKVYDEHISPLIDSLGKGISEIVGTVLDGYNTYIAPVLTKLSKNFKAVMEDKLQPAISAVLDAFGDLADTIKVLWEKRLQPLVNWVAKNIIPVFAKALENAGKIGSKVFGDICDTIKGLGKTFSGICGIIKGIVEGDWKQVWESCKKTISGIWESIVSIFKTKWDLIKGIFAPVGEFFGGVWKKIKGAFSEVVGWFKEKFTEAYNKVTFAFKLVGVYFKSKWKDIKDAFPDIKQWFSNKFSKAYEKVTSAFSGIKSFFKNVWVDIKSPFSDVITWFKSKFSKAWEAVKNVFSSGGKVFSGIKEGIADTFKTIVNKLISGINTIIKVPFEKINGMLNTIREVGVAGVKPFKGLWGKNPLSIPKIPALAQGGFVKANTPRLAMIGDNKRYGEIVAPENKMQDMADTAASKAGSVTANALIPVIERLCNAIIELEQSGGGSNLSLIPVSETGLYRIVEEEKGKENKRHGKR